MPAPATTSNLHEFIRKSGLHEKDRLEEYLQSIPNADELPPVELARRMVADGMLTDFQAKHLMKGRYRNFFIGKFKVLEPLGSGGMSQVYLCEHAVMKHRVAMKLLPVKESEDKGAVGRFMREARAAAAVNHPNVVRAHDFDLAEKKFYYLIMDYVDGVNLNDLVKKIGPIPYRTAANYIGQAAHGLQHIHECGLIHRDLKPSNLLIDRSGTIRILDLGLARFTDDDKDNLTRQLQGKSILGTADFLAPEQAIQSDNVDIRADIYSLGATLYFMLSGRAPFESQSVTQKLLAHQIREPDPLTNIPEDLAAIVRRMMHKQPDERYQTPNEVVEALREYLDNPPGMPDEEWFTLRAGGAVTPAGMLTNTSKPSPSTANLSMTNTPARVGYPVSRKTPASGGMASPPGSRGSGGPPSSRGGTGSMGGQSASARVAEFDPMDDTLPAKSSRKGLYIGGGIAAALIAAGVIGWALFGPANRKPSDVAKTSAASNSPPASKIDLTPSTADTPKGAHVVGPTGFATVAEAVNQAKPGDRIVVTAAKVEEAAVFNARAKGLTIEGWPESRQVLWTVPAGHDAGRPLVQVSNVDGLRIKNFQFDGKLSADAILGMTGTCTGVNFDNLKFSNFRSAGVDLTAAVGTSDRPIRFDTCRWLGNTAQATAIRISKPATGDGTTRGLTVVNCRFEGSELGRFGAGVKIGAPIDEMEFRGNRFFKMTKGIHYANRGSSATVLNATVIGNCFFEMGTAFLFDSVPPQGSNLNLYDNLFMKTEVMANTIGIDGRPNCTPGEWVCHANDVKRKDDGKIAGGQIPPGKRYYRKAFEMPDIPSVPIVMDISAASSFKVWLNGDPIGESRYSYYDKRVFSFPMAGKLKPGRNVIAVEVSHIADPLNANFQSSSGLMVRVGTEDRDDRVLVATDNSWVSISTPSAGWERPVYDDAKWFKVHVWTDELKVVWPWVGAVWDTAVRAKLAGSMPLAMNSSGNFRDYNSNEGFPLLGSARGLVNNDPKNFPQDPEDDSTFLRVPRGHALYKAGTDGRPVGVTLKE